MKALVYTKPNELVYRDEPDPAPGEGQVLIKVEAGSADPTCTPTTGMTLAGCPRLFWGTRWREPLHRGKAKVSAW